MISEVSLLTHERDNSKRATEERMMKLEKECQSTVQGSEK